MPPLAILGGIAVAGSIGGGILAKKGADAQAKAVGDASQQSIAEQQRQFDLNRSDLAPWRDQGSAAVGTLGRYLGQSGDPNSPDYGSLLHDFSAQDFQTDPGYQFQLSEGAKALQRSAAANGSLFSGGTLKALTRYNQNQANSAYGDAFNRFNTNRMNRYNMLAGLSQGGQQAANNTAQLGQQSANNISNTIMSAGQQIGDARASGYAGIGQAINGGISNGLNAYYLSKLPKK